MEFHIQPLMESESAGYIFKEALVVYSTLLCAVVAWNEMRFRPMYFKLLFHASGDCRTLRHLMDAA